VSTVDLLPMARVERWAPIGYPSSFSNPRFRRRLSLALDGFFLGIWRLNSFILELLAVRSLKGGMDYTDTSPTKNPKGPPVDFLKS